MKKIGIVTIIDNNNYGNRLQNYAVQKKINSLKCETVTLKNNITLNSKDRYFLRLIKFFISFKKTVNDKRLIFFEEFNKYIFFSKKNVTPFSNISNKYDYFIVGSDQFWNQNFVRLRDVDLLCFAKNKQKIAFAAIFGVNELKKKILKLKMLLNRLKLFLFVKMREKV